MTGVEPGRDSPVPADDGVAAGAPHIYGSTAPTNPPASGGPPAGRPPTHRRGSHGPPRRPWRMAVLVAVLLVVALVIAAVLWVRTEASPSGGPGAQVIVAVRPGTGANQLASTLEAKGVIGSSLAYRIWGQFHSVPGVQTGSYAFDKNSSFAAVDTVISAGPNVFPLVIPPGFTVGEVAQRVGQLPGHDATAFDGLATGGTVRSPWEPAGSNSLEGLLGTGRYTVVPGETDQHLLTAMIDRFDTLADQLHLTAGAAALGLTPYQVVTVASIVEKEGVLVKNMGPVARVVLNRLHNDMPLQMDSTVLYAEGRDGGTVTSKDLALHTPYNTYLNKGLTPTPICFPSPAALQAALEPPGRELAVFRGGPVRRDGGLRRHVRPAAGQRGTGPATGPALSPSHSARLWSWI